jgi:molybdopterin/thiamine biosynthesis adenylyltransferase
VRISTSTTPLGPYLAASFLAGEVFKRARGVTRGGPIQSLGYSLWTGADGEWSSLDAGPALSDRDLPPFYLVGVGAVGQGVAQILGATSFTRGCMVAIDDDRHDKTNLNRCFLAGCADVGDPKMDAVTRYLKETPVQCLPHVGTLVDYAAKAKPSTNVELARAESEGRYEVIVSCVDKGKSRQDIQGLRPRLIIGGSTSGLTAKTNVYDFAPGTPCLGCHNPPEKDAERLRELERVLRAMSRDEQIAYLRGRGVDPEPILLYLADGRCGSAGEGMLRDMATGSTREFSVSFVSMAAAVLLAARLFSRVGRRPAAHELHRVPARERPRHGTRRGRHLRTTRGERLARATPPNEETCIRCRYTLRS